MWSRLVMSQVKHNSYFITGVVLGLWVSLAVIPLEEEVAPCAAAVLAPEPPPDEYEPRREEKPVGPRQPARALQRPRYYTTELGMRGSVLAGVLTSEAQLSEQAAVLNRTLAVLQPALKFFITASAISAPGLANVVGFTDTREMLKPFHALKYLADNFLEEYDFFFLITDGAYVDGRRLLELVSRLSVSQHVHMGEPHDERADYCSLDGGILLSNSVLRAVHGELEWCVRNSYSPHHHENVGRCVLHAAHAPCARVVQAQEYAGVAARGVRGADALRAHARAARERLRRGRAEAARLRADLWRNRARHPPGYRNATWPAGLRADPGLAPPRPEDRHSHARWTPFNGTHALMPDERRAAARLRGAADAALRAVVGAAEAWVRRRWAAQGAGAGADVALVEGAWRWEPARALRYKLLLRLTDERGAQTLRQLEVVRPLGAARLVPVRYVTESARVTLVVAVTRDDTARRDALAFLERYERLALDADKNTQLVAVGVGVGAHNGSEWAPLRAALAALPSGAAEFLPLEHEEEDERRREWRQEWPQRAAGAALRAARARVPAAALLLLAPPHLDCNQDFLNRVRMNTIQGEQWFSPLPFARYSQYSHPRFVTATGARPQVNTGHFRTRAVPLLAVYAQDYDLAMSRWRGPEWAVEEALARSPLRCVRAPEPGAVLQPRPAACPAEGAPPGAAEGAPRPAPDCLRGVAPGALDLGARTALAQLLLEMQSEAD